MRSRVLRRLHRWVGLCAALFVLLFAVSGVALNHTERLRLDERVLDWPFLAALYGMQPPPVDRAWRTGAGELVVVDGRVFLAGREMSGRLRAAPVGAVAIDDLLAVATASSLRLYRIGEGLLIEELEGVHGLPLPVTALGRRDGRLALRAGDQWFRADAALLEWQPVSGGDPVRAVAPRPETVDHIRRQLGGTGPDLERVLLDLHSGRLFGAAGVWVADLMALALLFLAATGIWVVVKRH